MYRHHFRVHAERDVGLVSTTRAFEWREGALRTVLLLRSMLRLILLLLQLLLQVGDSWTIHGTVGNTAMLERAAVEARAVVIVALSDNLATTDNNAAMTVVQRRLRSLLEAEGQIVVGLHVDVSVSY